MTPWAFLFMALWIITAICSSLKILDLHGRVANAQRFEEQAHVMNDRLNAENRELKDGFFPDWLPNEK